MLSAFRTVGMRGGSHAFRGSTRVCLSSAERAMSSQPSGIDHRNVQSPMVLNNFSNVIPYLVFQQSNDETTIVVDKSNLIFSLLCLKKHFGFQYNLLTCISGVDLLGLKHRFCVVYDLLSLVYNARLRVKVFLTEATKVDSSVQVYINANWWEREVWDMYGVYFDKHPDLRRILTDYGFEGYPLRKDFPLSGFFEVGYSDTMKGIEEKRIELTQGYRYFSS